MLSFVGFFTRMCELMVFVVSLLVEALAAELADIRFIAIVDPYMSVEGGRSVKGFSTSATFMWFLSCMYYFVSA